MSPSGQRRVPRAHAFVVELAKVAHHAVGDDALGALLVELAEAAYHAVGNVWALGEDGITEGLLVMSRSQIRMLHVAEFRCLSDVVGLEREEHR